MAKAPTKTGKKKVFKKKEKKTVLNGIVYVQATFNNTIVSITDTQGNLVCWSSAGSLGFKGSRKGTPFAATQVGTKIAKELSGLGVQTVEVNMEGPGSGRDAVVRALQASGLNISVLRDVTPLPHNGTRPPKKRRM